MCVWVALVGCMVHAQLLLSLAGMHDQRLPRAKVHVDVQLVLLFVDLMSRVAFLGLLLGGGRERDTALRTCF